jgi:hypothetical protein
VNAKSAPFSDFILALAGPIVWAAHFFIVYGLEAAVCATAESPTLTMRWIIAAATATAVAGLVALLIQLLRKLQNGSEALRFLHKVSLCLSLISIGAVLAVAASALRLSACVQPLA